MTTTDREAASPWLVGGPGRCGKTHLVLTLSRLRGPVAGFPLEALFTVYCRRRFPFFRRSRAGFLEEYLTRPRYVDAERAASETPLDYFSSSLDQLRAAIPDACDHPISLIGWMLDRFAADNGGRTWAAFDLHPELLYPHFRRRLPGLRLAVMVRDPREAVCAALFWRGDPGSGAARDARFKHCLILWCLGVQTGRILARRWPDDVRIFDFNALVSGNERECRQLAECFGLEHGAVKDAYDFRPDFRYVPGDGFRVPEGSTVPHLGGDELMEIALLASPYVDGRPAEAADVPGGARPRRGFVLFARIVLFLGRAAPGLARAMADLAYYPGRYVTRRINEFRRFVRDAWLGLRPARGSSVQEAR